ncbi:PilZ domain-containing protein [Novosphingobium resinovorum]|uniref:PilZ domain-containing protein n=1 Tax=Novosphingobium resinovorum TaxID=158500 RepID=UPI002ED311B4|nr:PilZ domain-containing protein [Novosphingobium resinovorum]
MARESHRNEADYGATSTRGRRGSSRLRVRLAARLVTRTETWNVVLCDLSRHGARVVTGRALAPGLEVILEWGGFDAFGEVVWCDGDRCGLAFVEPIEEAALIATRGLDDSARLPRDSDLVRDLARRWVEGSARL